MILSKNKQNKKRLQESENKFIGKSYPISKLEKELKKYFDDSHIKEIDSDMRISFPLAKIIEQELGLTREVLDVDWKKDGENVVVTDLVISDEPVEFATQGKEKKMRDKKLTESTMDELEYIYEQGYTPKFDMTVIVKWGIIKDENGNDVPVSKEIVGFYQGEPNDGDLEYYKNKGVKWVGEDEIAEILKDKYGKDESLQERNLTKSERANRNLDSIFRDYDARLERMKDFLRKNTEATEEEIRAASDNTGLHSSDKDLWGLLKKYGVYDEFFAQDKKNESLKEEYGPFKDEPYLEEIANRAESGDYYGDVDGIDWEITFNGCSCEDFKSEELREYMLVTVSYPIKDGHLGYYDLDCFIPKDFLSNADVREDLKNIFQLEDEDLVTDSDEFEFWCDFDVDFDVDEWESENQDEDESLKEEKEIAQSNIDWVNTWLNKHYPQDWWGNTEVNELTNGNIEIFFNDLPFGFDEDDQDEFIELAKDEFGEEPGIYAKYEDGESEISYIIKMPKQIKGQTNLFRDFGIEEESLKESDDEHYYYIKFEKPSTYAGYDFLRDGNGDALRFSSPEKAKEYIEKECGGKFYNYSVCNYKGEPVNTEVNIRESLNKIDLDTDNQFDLRNLYDSCIMTEEQKKGIAKIIYESASPRKLYDKLMKYFM